MSQTERLGEGVYKQGDEVIVVLPSDKVVFIEEITTVPQVHHHEPTSTFQKLQEKVHDMFQSKPVQPVELEIVKVEPVPVETQNVFGQDLEFKRYWQDFKQSWNNFDSEAAFHITEFKRQYVLPIGEIPVRSVCMAVSTGLCYALLGRRSPSILSRTRNLAASFVVNGAFWLPQHFNPMLLRQTTI